VRDCNTTVTRCRADSPQEGTEDTEAARSKSEIRMSKSEQALGYFLVKRSKNESQCFGGIAEVFNVLCAGIAVTRHLSLVPCRFVCGGRRGLAAMNHEGALLRGPGFRSEVPAWLGCDATKARKTPKAPKIAAQITAGAAGSSGSWAGRSIVRVSLHARSAKTIINCKTHQFCAPLEGEEPRILGLGGAEAWQNWVSFATTWR